MAIKKYDLEKDRDKLIKMFKDKNEVPKNVAVTFGSGFIASHIIQ